VELQAAWTLGIHGRPPRTMKCSMALGEYRWRQRVGERFIRISTIFTVGGTPTQVRKCPYDTLDGYKRDQGKSGELKTVLAFRTALAETRGKADREAA